MIAGMLFSQCPRAWAIGDGRAAMDCVRDIAAYNASSVLPDGGGRLDQCQRWLDAVAVVNSYLASLQKSKQVQNG